VADRISQGRDRRGLRVRLGKPVSRCQIMAAAKEAVTARKSIKDCPKDLLPWLPIWIDAFRQSEIDQQHKEIA
jgi:hypothetical protein